MFRRFAPSFTQKTTAGFAAAGLVLIVGALSYWGAHRALDASRLVSHTQKVIAELEDVLTDLVDMETGARGYVITGAPRYLEPFVRGARNAGGSLASVRRLTSDNRAQQQRLDSLEPLVAEKLRLSQALIAMRRAGTVATGVPTSVLDSSKAVMDDIRRRIASMQRDERSLLERRTSSSRSGERIAATITVVGSVLAFALIVLMIWVIYRDVRLQRRTAVQRDRALARERRAREQLSAIQRVTDATLAPMALDELLAELMRRVREVLAVDAACVLLLMRDGVHLEVCKCVGVTETITDRVKIPVGEGLEGLIASRGEPAVVPDLRTVQVYDPVVRDNFASILGAPLVSREAAAPNHVIGVVHVETVRARQFTDDERDLLVLVAERAASAIERARLYQSERRAEAQFRALMEGVSDYAIYTLDANGNVSSWNTGAERLKGYRAQEILGRPADQMYTEEDQAAGVPQRERNEALATGHSLRQAWRVRKDGSRFWAEVAVTALHDLTTGDLIGFAHVTRDLTERRAADAALIAARDAAESANQAKSQFLATMSHEIRTPINAIVGYVELLELELDGPLTDQQRSRLARIRSSARHLLRLVEEVLDLAKIEAQQLNVERVSGRVSDVVASTLPLVYPQASARGIAIVNRCLPESDVGYMGDAHRVGQILVNLLSNAVKFTPEGGRITLDCGHTEEARLNVRLADSECWCFVSVTDTGIGVAADQRERVFDPFVQAMDDDHSRVYTRPHGGTGLGLTISRRLARLMGGDVTLVSELGAGSTFTLWLPAPPDVRRDADGVLSRCVTTERRSAVRQSHGLSVVGDTLRVHVEELMRLHIARLRANLDAPRISELSDNEMEDHVGTLVADMARALVLIEDAEGDASRMLRDGSEIQRAIAERHGRQRASLGWTTETHQQEMRLLRDDIERLLRDRLGTNPDADVEGAMEVLTRLLAHAERAGHLGMEMSQRANETERA